jgi:hypothetical protein
MPDRKLPFQVVERGGSENFVHVTHTLVANQLFPLRDGDPGALLAAMLERVKTQVG